MNSRLFITLLLAAGATMPVAAETTVAHSDEEAGMGKPVVYQVFTRLFGSYFTSSLTP